MSKLQILINIILLSLPILSAGNQAMQPKSLATHDVAVTVASPNRRYVVRFSKQRSDGKGAGKLWGTITIRDQYTGRERTARVAEGHRGKGVFEGFSLYEDSPAWSPDGLYLAYWDDYCQDEPAVSGGVVCHLHEVHFLSMKVLPLCREELVLSRYGFGGWARRQAHTILEILINEEGQKVERSPCAKRV